MNERPLFELNGRITKIDNQGQICEGVVFLCPLCPWTHSIIATWSGPSLYQSGAVWRLQSAPEIDVLTLSPSINCDVPPVYPDGWSEEDKKEDEETRCRFHGWVQNGKVSWIPVPV